MNNLEIDLKLADLLNLEVTGRNHDGITINRREGLFLSSPYLPRSSPFDQIELRDRFNVTVDYNTFNVFIQGRPVVNYELRTLYEAVCLCVIDHLEYKNSQELLT